MTVLAILLGELVALSLLSRRLTGAIYTLFIRIFRSRTIALTILVILLFPGTVIHELAHLFVAEILRVRTGKLTLVPESLTDGEMKTGSVAIASTDPFRRTLIGLAPVYVGIAALAALSYFLSSSSSLYSSFFILYSLFAVSNSMFASPEDMKGVIPFTITVGIFAAAAYVAGVRVGITGELLNRVTSLLEMLVPSLGIVLAVNLAMLAVTSLFLTLIPRRQQPRM